MRVATKIAALFLLKIDVLMVDAFQACNICLDSNGSIFKDLPRNEKDMLITTHSFRIVKKGDLVFREGDKPSGALFLAQGKVKIFKEGISGREQIIRLAKPTDIIGYRALIADEKHQTSAMAIEDSAICLFRKNEIVKIVEKHPEILGKMLKSLANELRLSHSRTVSLTQKHIRGRLAESIVFLYDTYGFEEDGRTIKAYLSREDLASLSNMTASNAIRTLTQFSEEGVIATEGRKVKVMNQGLLEKISEIG